MFVVDADPLQPIDFLNLVDEIGGKFLDALDRQNVMRRRISIDDIIALFDDVAVLKMDMFAFWDQIFNWLGALFIRNDRNARLVLVVAPELHSAGGLGDNCVILRPARLEELGDSRQTAGDVARLCRVHRDTCNDVAGLDQRAWVNPNDRIHRQRITRIAAAMQLADLAVRRFDHDGGLQCRGALIETPVHDQALGNTGSLVDGFRHRGTFDQILEADRPGDLGQNWPCIGIPLSNALAALDLVAVVDFEPGAILDPMDRAFRAVWALDDDCDIARHDHKVALAIAGEMAIADLHDSIEIGFDEGLIGDLRRAADVEGAHRELRARLADRLRGDDPDGLAHIHRRAAREIAAVALAANAVLGFAGQDGADLNYLDPGRVDAVDVPFLNHFAGGEDDRARGLFQILGRGAAKDSRRERGDNLARVDDRAHPNPVPRSAIEHGNNRVLRHIDKTARQITRIRGLQGGVGKTLSRAMRRVEILEHGQPFLEVRDDRAFDDLARWLRHQSAHRGELLYLGWRTARAGMRHHVDRVDRFVAAVRVLLHRRNARHHLLGELVRTFHPDIDDLVVFFALRDQSVIILLLVFLRERACLGDNARLGIRHDHVVLTEGNTGLERLAEPERHDLVAKDDCLLLTAVAVDDVDHGRDFLFGHEFVHDIEGNLDMTRQQLAKNHTAGRGFENLRYTLSLAVEGPRPPLDPGVQGDRLGMQGMFHLAHIGERH